MANTLYQKKKKKKKNAGPLAKTSLFEEKSSGMNSDEEEEEEEVVPNLTPGDIYGSGAIYDPDGGVMYEGESEDTGTKGRYNPHDPSTGGGDGSSDDRNLTGIEPVDDFLGVGKDFLQAFSGQKSADAARYGSELAFETERQNRAAIEARYQQGREDTRPWREQQEEFLGITGDKMKAGDFDPGAFEYESRGDYVPEEFQEIAPWEDPGMYQAEAWDDPGNFTMADFQADPGYEFRRQQGLTDMESSAMARGGYGGTRDMQNLIDYSQGAASQEFGAARDRYNQDRGFSRQNYLQDRGFGSSQWDQNRGFGAGRYDIDRGYNRGRYQDDRGFGANQWNQNRAFDYGSQFDQYGSRAGNADRQFNQYGMLSGQGSLQNAAANQGSSVAQMMANSSSAGANAMGQGAMQSANALSQGAGNIAGAGMFIWDRIFGDDD
jgi:hypothetical protein